MEVNPELTPFGYQKPAPSAKLKALEGRNMIAPGKTAGRGRSPG
jgi:hypothetical protein